MRIATGEEADKIIDNGEDPVAKELRAKGGGRRQSMSRAARGDRTMERRAATALPDHHQRTPAQTIVAKRISYRDLADMYSAAHQLRHSDRRVGWMESLCAGPGGHLNAKEVCLGHRRRPSSFTSASFGRGSLQCPKWLKPQNSGLSGRRMTCAVAQISRPTA
jgi:hypothetical protein